MYKLASTIVVAQPPLPLRLFGGTAKAYREDLRRSSGPALAFDQQPKCLYRDASSEMNDASRIERRAIAEYQIQ